MSCGNLEGRGVWGRMDTCVYVAEFLHCSPKTIVTLLIGNTPIQNKKFEVKKKELGILEDSGSMPPLWVRGLRPDYVAWGSLWLRQ